MFNNPEKECLNKLDNIENEADKEIELTKIKDFLRIVADKMQQEGVPVRSNCRIEIDAFKHIYSASEIERDKQYIARIEEPSEKSRGEQLEMLKTALFNKFLSKSFITVRASRFDDIANKADNIIIDRISGNIVCALDEVGEISGSRFETKKEQVLAKNKEGGVLLKYALRVDNGQIKPSATIKGLPLFYLALPQNHICDGIKAFTPSYHEHSSYEQRLFNYFMSSIHTQIATIELNQNLDDGLKKRLDSFKKILKESVQKPAIK